VPVVQLAAQFRKENSPLLSQADVNVFIATETLKYTARIAGGRMRVPFKTGRVDCDLSNGFPVRIFPDPGSTDSVEYLMETFELSARQAVGLIGES